jgi:DNA-binding MarR family transcriptional regulator
MKAQSTEIGELFSAIEKRLRHAMRRCFVDKGITMPQGMLIGILHKQGEVKVTELSEKMGLSNSTVSGIIDRLEKQDIVERVRSQEDRRIVYVKLTKKYSEAHKGFDKIASEQFAIMIDGGSKEELDKIIEGLRTLKAILDRNSDKPDCHSRLLNQGDD